MWIDMRIIGFSNREKCCLKEVNGWDYTDEAGGAT
jgi:hypothetical protein